MLAPGPSSAGPDGTAVTFVRPESPCDLGEYAILVDDHGHFVGNLAAGTRLVHPTTPGDHAYYAWSNVDLIVDRVPNFNPVSAVRVHAVPGQSSYVLLDNSKPCQSRFAFDMLSVNRGSGAWGDVAQALASTKPVRVDRAAGQLALDARPAHTQLYRELGVAKLQRNDQADTARVRQVGLRHEESFE